MFSIHRLNSSGRLQRRDPRYRDQPLVYADVELTPTGVILNGFITSPAFVPLVRAIYDDDIDTFGFEMTLLAVFLDDSWLWDMVAFGSPNVMDAVYDALRRGPHFHNLQYHIDQETERNMPPLSYEDALREAVIDLRHHLDLRPYQRPKAQRADALLHSSTRDLD